MKREAGASLIVAIVVTLMLTILAMTVIQSVNTQTKVAGQSRSSENALYIAEAGIAWGINTLQGEPYNIVPGSDFTSLFDSLKAEAPVISSSDATWPQQEGGKWYELINSRGFGSGTFRVAVSDDVDGDADPNSATLATNLDSDNNKQILLRSLGTDASGSQRLIEVVLTSKLEQAGGTP